jgi:hypothetical protein
MTAGDVLDVLKLFERHAIEVIIDGGWAVDALLGEHTRPHSDLDIAMPHKHVPLARQLLEERGYRDVPRSDTRDCNFVMGDDSGRTVDIHTYTYDDLNLLLVWLTRSSRCKVLVRLLVARSDASLPVVSSFTLAIHLG